MANYASLADIQAKLWIETLDTFTTTRLNFFLTKTTAIINSLLWTLESSDKIEQIKLCDIKDCWFYLSQRNVTAIKKINWITYTWVKWTDYQIVLGRKIIIYDIANYLANLNFLYFDIEYTSWYTTIPEDIKYLQCIMVDWEFNSEWWAKLKSYSLWPRSVTFMTKNEEDFDFFKSIMWNYNLFYNI